MHFAKPYRHRLRSVGPFTTPISSQANDTVKLVSRVTLEYREGTSDKVYEVDLCEVEDGRFHVNFRYGRRGTVLREGSKTPTSVTQGEALRIFNSLVASKEAKGYTRRELAASETGPGDHNSDFQSAATDSDHPIAEAVLRRIADGHSSSSDWSLSRAVWRCGELRLAPAEPLLLKLLGTKDAMLDYCITWALGQCGSANSINALTELEASHPADSVRRIAGMALLQLLEGPKRDATISECIQQLPNSLQSLAVNGPASELETELQRLFAAQEDLDGFVWELLYLIDNRHTRPALLSYLQSAPLEPGHFHHVRHLFKAAELRRDAEVFGLIARRFEVTVSTFNMKSPWYYPQEQLPTTGPEATRAYSHQTRRFLRRRVWRTLTRLVDAGQTRDFARMAAGVLAAYTDSDTLPTRQEVEYYWDAQARRSRYERVHFDHYWAYYAFNQILFANSSRYQLQTTGLKFRCVNGYEPGGSEPAEREEAYPEIWQKHPDVVVELLVISRCEIVHRFGTKVLRACQAFCREMELSSLIALLQSPYESTAQFAFELVVSRYDPDHPDRKLVAGVANCTFQPARQQAFEWIRANRLIYQEDSEFLAELIASPHRDTRLFARDLVRQATTSSTTAQALIGRLMASLQELGPADSELASDVTETLILAFGNYLRRVTEDVIRELLDHDLPEIQRFAGELVLGHATFAQHPPDGVIAVLLSSDHATVRGVAIRIIDQLPDPALRGNPDLLFELARHERDDIREAIRPTIQRLAGTDRGFGQRFASRLVQALLIPGAAEGVPSHTARMLREDLREFLDGIPAKTVWNLLQSRSAPAQEVGGDLLSTNVDASELSVESIVRLADHEILSVRESACAMCGNNVEKCRGEPEVVAQLTDSPWEDTRRFGFDFLTRHFMEERLLTPDILIGICDSVREDTQQFGRELVTRLFADGHGESYVLKLSEHPAEPMQLFASGFLEQHLGDDPDSLSQLAPFFLSILTRVNRGRVAKIRARQILHREALKSEQAARTAVDILERISATTAVMDREAAVEILLAIRQAWPAIETPLAVVPTEVRDGV